MYFFVDCGKIKMLEEFFDYIEDGERLFMMKSKAYVNKSQFNEILINLIDGFCAITNDFEKAKELQQSIREIVLKF